MFAMMAKYNPDFILLRSAPLKPTILIVCTRVARFLAFETHRIISRRLHNAVLWQTRPLGNPAKKTFDSVSFYALLADKSCFYAARRGEQAIHARVVIDITRERREIY